jgi:L-iditol 2-dehydrogenase
MRAAVYYSPNNILLEDRDDLRPPHSGGRREVLMRVKACAVCGYDANVYRNGHTKVTTPVVLGHELCGEISETPRIPELQKDQNRYVNTAELTEGSRVIVSPLVPCLRCMYCVRARYNLCINLREIGSNIDGGFAEYVEIPKNTLKIGGLVTLPATLTDEESTLVEPLACCLNGFKHIRTLINDAFEDQTFVILGDGPIGLMHLQLAKRLLGAKVIVVGRVNHRMQMARNFGADFVVDNSDNDNNNDNNSDNNNDNNSNNNNNKNRNRNRSRNNKNNDSTTSAIKDVIDLTDGKGANVTIIATSNPVAVKVAAGVAAKNSVVNIFAGMPRHINIGLDPNWIHYNQISLTGSFSATPKLIRESIMLVAEKRKIDLSSIITHRCKLDEIYKALQITEEFLGLRAVINSF